MSVAMGDFMKSKNGIIRACIMASLVIVPLVFVPIGTFGDYFYLPKVYALRLIVLFFLLFACKNREVIKDIVSTEIGRAHV